MVMHAGQAEFSAEQVAALVARQFPEFRDLPVEPVASGGTVNALFRIGDDVVVRLPLVPDTGEARRADLAEELHVVQRVVDQLPVGVPEPLGLGAPAPEYRGHWTAYRWLPGSVADVASTDRHPALARELAGFVTALRTVESDGRRWSGRGRGGPLSTRDDSVRAALAASIDLVDTEALAAAWDRCLANGGTAWSNTWIHADLMPGNLLMLDGRLSAVIDWGSATVGDPAVDLMPAWNLFGEESRSVFRGALGVDEEMWERGRGWAIVQAIVALPYYVDTNQAMVDNAFHTLAAVLDDP